MWVFHRKLGGNYSHLNYEKCVVAYCRKIKFCFLQVEVSITHFSARLLVEGQIGITSVQSLTGYERQCRAQYFYHKMQNSFISLLSVNFIILHRVVKCLFLNIFCFLLEKLKKETKRFPFVATRTVSLLEKKKQWRKQRRKQRRKQI